MVVRFNIGEGKIRAHMEATQPLVLSFFGEDTDHGGTTNSLLGDG